MTKLHHVPSTKENCRKLASKVVEDMDLDALIVYAEDGITEFYYRNCDTDTWEEDWKNNMEE